MGMPAAAVMLVAAMEHGTSPPVPTPPVTASQPALKERPHAQRAAGPEHSVGLPAGSERLAPASEAATEESTIAEYTDEKYRFLIEDLQHLDAAQTAELRRLLRLRERLAGEGNGSLQPALAEAERGILGLLPAADHATYQALKESDLELYELNEYAGGVSHVAPLSMADREAILRTKLAYKARFRQMLADSGLGRADLGAAEREYAYRVSSRALDDFRRDYLQEVRQYLVDDEQFALLSNYETCEFKADLARLRSMADLPSQVGS
jgi:hypothetical protein